MSLAAVFGAALLAAAPAAGADWPMFRGDPAHTGVAAPPERMLASPRRAWTRELGGDPLESSAAIAGDTVYIGTPAGEVVALDLQNGNLRWKFHIAGAGGVRSSPAVGGGMVYAGDDAGVFHAIDIREGPKRGQLVWSFKAGAEIVSSPTLTGGLVLFGCYDGFLYCLQAADGKLKWKFETEAQVHASPTVLGGVALIAGCDGQLRAVDLQSGGEASKTEMGAYAAATPAAAGSSAYLGTYGNNVLGIDWQKRTVSWVYEDPDRQFPFHASAALAGQKLIVAGRDKQVRALDRQTGKGIWSFSARARIDSSPVVCGPAVFVGSSDGDLYLLDLENGERRWSYTLGSPITSSPAIASGRLVIGSGDGSLYCFDLRAVGEDKLLKPGAAAGGAR